MLDSRQDVESAGVHRYTPLRDGAPIAFREVLSLWHDDDEFRSFCISLLADSPFRAFRWETPPITRDTAKRDFEFVLIDAPELMAPVDAQTFAHRFAGDATPDSVATFDNLGGDATLVVPAPCGPESAYPHLAAFVRHAPDVQRHALFRALGRTAQQLLSDQPLWINTAGTGVAWLHVRLDSRPKYYLYDPYKRR